MNERLNLSFMTSFRDKIQKRHLARSFKDLYKTYHIQERAKECCKQSPDPGYFAKIQQEYLSITY